MKYRPIRELLEESLRDQVEITTWQELVDICDKGWHRNPIQISWEHQKYDDRCGWDTWIILVKEPQYSTPIADGYMNGDPMNLIGCPGILPEATKYRPYPRNEKQKYQKGDRVRIHTVGHPIWEGKKVYDMAPDKVGKLATIVGSYYDQFGGDPEQDPHYTIECDDGTGGSWYYEYQLEPENTPTPCTERIESAVNSEFVKEGSKIWKEMENMLMWGVKTDEEVKEVINKHIKDETT